MNVLVSFCFTAAPFRKSTLGKKDVFLVHRLEKPAPIEQ